jgi:hypothetical protein
VAEWVLIFTTPGPEGLPTDPVMALYRVRRQVALVIKRLKSILTIDHLHARKDRPLTDLYRHGQPLYAWVIEKRLGRRCGDDGNRLDQPRRATPWRVLKLLQRELASALHATGPWNLNRWPEAMPVVQERRRRRTLPTVPERVSRPIASCQAQGLSNI